MLETSKDSKESVRQLQRKLYRKAKHESTFRFYSLYDKVYRGDVLYRAYDLVRQNKGSPGIDGVSFATIEAEIGKGVYLQELQEALKEKTYRTMPVKRVGIPKANGESRALGIPCIRDRIVQMAVKLVIEPIFEADFSPHSYGFRPKRSAHQAIDAVKDGLFSGHVHVIDADLSKYFDTIPHTKLLKVVSQRIVDKQLLALLKQWLKVLVVKVEHGKETVVAGGKKSTIGTPQGGVISPLLGNIYLNILDRIWVKYRLAEKYQARLIRYADDLVILCAGDPTWAYAALQDILAKLELKLNEDKTQIRDSRVDEFDFLGFSTKLVKAPKSGKYFPLIEPSDKALKSIKRKIKYYTRRDMTPVPLCDVVSLLSSTSRGWCTYFHYGHCQRKMKVVRYYMEESLRRHLRYRHKLPNRGASYIRFPRHYIYEHLGLYKVPLSAAWKCV